MARTKQTARKTTDGKAPQKIKKTQPVVEKVVEVKTVKDVKMSKAVLAFYEKLAAFVEEDQQDAFRACFEENLPARHMRAKSTKVKDPEKPKGAKSAFAFFCSDKKIRERIMQENPDVPSTAVFALASKLWNSEYAPGDMRRKPYAVLAEQDKERHAREMAEYTPPSETELQERAKKTKSKHKGKNPFQFFLAERREATKEELKKEQEWDNGRDLATAVMGRIGELWKSEFKDTDKAAPYILMAEAEHERMAEATEDSEEEKPKVKRKTKKAKKEVKRKPAKAKKAPEPEPEEDSSSEDGEEVEPKARVLPAYLENQGEEVADSGGESDNEVAGAVDKAAASDSEDEPEPEDQCEFTFKINGKSHQKGDRCPKGVYKNGRCKLHIRAGKD